MTTLLPFQRTGSVSFTAYNLTAGWPVSSTTARDARSLELGYVTLPRYQNRGVMTEALTAAIAEAFRAGYQRVEAGFFEGNTASRRVMEKCGMKASGRVETVNRQGREIRTVFYEVHKEKSE